MKQYKKEIMQGSSVNGNENTGEDDSSSAPMKSGRPRKPKKFEDCITPGKPKPKTPRLVSPVDKQGKVLAKLAAYANTQVKEEKILGQDNEEYVYRNVFVPEILTGSRRRSCTQKKKEAEDMECLKLASKAASSKPKTNNTTSTVSHKQQTTSTVEVIATTKQKTNITSSTATNKQDTTNNLTSVNVDNVETKKKKSESKLKLSIDVNKNSCSTVSSDYGTSKKKRDNSEKKKSKDNCTMRKDVAKSLVSSVDTPVLKQDIRDPCSNKRKYNLDLPLDGEPIKADIQAKKTITEFSPGISPPLEKKERLHSDSETSTDKPSTDESSDDKPKPLKHAVKILKKSNKEVDEKKPGDGKKHVKFDDKEHVKIFERDPPEPTLVDAIKERRKKSRGLHISSDDYDHFPELDVPKPEERRGKKRKQKSHNQEELPIAPKAEEKEEPIETKVKDEKCTKRKHKNSKSTEHVESSLAPPKEGSEVRKTDLEKHNKKNKTSSPKAEKNEKLFFSSSLDSSEPPLKKKKSKSKEEESDPVTDELEPQSEASPPIVLTFKSSDITTSISQGKKKETKSHVYDKVSTKLSKKSDSKKEKKKHSKKNKNKLIVSFSNQSFLPKKKKSTMKDEVDSQDDDLPSQDENIPSGDGSSSDDVHPKTPESTEEGIKLPSQSSPLSQALPTTAIPTPEIEAEEPPAAATPAEDTKQKKKKTKKSKNKLKKDERILSTELFEVADKVITRVKKKKIYKKRNEEKVLVRIIKNHCNKNGDVVKTETIVVDEQQPSANADEDIGKKPTTPGAVIESPKIEIKQENMSPEKVDIDSMDSIIDAPLLLEADIKVEEQNPTVLEKSEGAENKSSSPEPKPTGSEKKSNQSEKKSAKRKAPVGEKKVVSEKKCEDESTPEVVPEKEEDDQKREDSPEYFPSLRKEFSSHAKKRKANFKHSLETSKSLKSTGDKRPMLKKGQKLVKKSLSRPANKNVTVGGKVVGKTTKGMKKTGDGSALTQPPKISSFEAIAQDLPPQLTPVTEPKNVYNYFCRKYRPIVVKQFPKADFSEISRRLAALWKSLTEVEKQEQRDKFEEIHSVSQQKLAKLGRVSPTQWSEGDVKFIKKNIGENDAYAEVFNIPKYPVKRLAPIDMAAHLSLLGDSLNMISSALQQQSSMTVHGAMSVLLDSILSAIAPLVFFTSHVPEMKAIDEPQQARILDNLAYILPGL